MKTLLKISGILTAIAFFTLTLLLFVFWPNLMEVINQSYAVLNFVRNNIVDQNSATRCTKELIWVASIFLMVVLIIAVLFFRIQTKKKIGIELLILLLFVQFYLLQTPVFILLVGKYYNCETDGQTGLAILVSTPMVSLLLIAFGVIYDVINKKKSEKLPPEEDKDNIHIPWK
jgi:hypothetical protein